MDWPSVAGWNSAQPATCGSSRPVLGSASVPTLRAAKAVADMTTRQLTAKDTELLARIAVEVYDGPDLAEGVAAFHDRRAPGFPSQNAKVPTKEVYQWPLH